MAKILNNILAIGCICILALYRTFGFKVIIADVILILHIEELVKNAALSAFTEHLG